MIDLELTDEQRLLQQAVRERTPARSLPAFAISTGGIGSTPASCPQWRSGEDAAQ